MNYGTREADQPRPQQKRGGAGGRVAQERGTAHQLTNKERECNLSFAMCLTLLPHASAADLADQPHEPHISSSCSCCVLG